MSKENNNNLLISGDYPLIASPTLAKAYGVAAANFLQKLHYCLENNEGKTFNGKKYWFHSYEQWQQTLGVYSISTIKRVVARLKKTGILVIEKLAQNKWLQTNFYTINYKKLKQLISPDNELKSQAKQPSQAPAKTTTETTPETSIQAQAVETSLIVNAIQQAFKTFNPQSKAIEPSLLKVANDSHAKSDAIMAENDKTRGLDQPRYTAASKEILKNMDMNHRHFYQALRQQRVDIHYDDRRIQQLLKHQKQIIRHIVYIKQNFLGQERYRWHQLEQLQLDTYFIRNNTSPISSF